MPIIAFSGKADIKIKVDEACVVYWSQIRKVINQFEEKRLTALGIPESERPDPFFFTIDKVFFNNL